MIEFPEGYDIADPASLHLNLASAEIDGKYHRFIVGTDGRFTDVRGREWFGSQLISSGDLEVSLQGIAPSGSLTLSFIQDPDAPELIEQVRELGAEYVDGWPIRFYIQPLLSMDEFHAPTLDPILYLTRTMRKITYTLSGAQNRSMSLSFESVFEARNGARRRVYNTTDHSQMVGSANPSLMYIPTDNRRDEKIWG